MKKLFTVILILTQLSVFAEDTTTTQISDVERVVDKYVDKTTEALKGLAEALQVPADHVYNVLISQQKLISISYILLFFLGLIGLFTTTKIVRYMIKKDYEDAGYVIVGIVGGVIFLIITIIGIGHTEIILTGFINPEYGAIKEISNLIK